MVSLAFMEKHRRHLRHSHILHCCTTKNPSYDVHCLSPHSFIHTAASHHTCDLRVLAHLTAVLQCVRVSRVRDQITVVRTAMVNTVCFHNAGKAVVLW